MSFVYLLYTDSDAPHYFLKIWVSIWFHFPSAWRTSFSIFGRASLGYCEILIFSYLKMSLFYHDFWKIILLEIKFYIDYFFKKSFSTLKIITFDEKAVVTWVLLLCRQCIAFFCLLLRYFSLSLVFAKLTAKYLGIGLFVLILLGAHCTFVSFIKFVRISTIIS